MRNPLHKHEGNNSVFSGPPDPECFICQSILPKEKTPSEEAINKIIDRANEGADDAEVQDGNTCQCCGKEPSVGVASVPFVPMSIAWGRQCLTDCIVPLWVCFAQATSGFDEGESHPPVGREMFNEEWLDWHDRTLARFGVTEDEFWAAVNA